MQELQNLDWNTHSIEAHQVVVDHVPRQLAPLVCPTTSLFIAQHFREHPASGAIECQNDLGASFAALGASRVSNSSENGSQVACLWLSVTTRTFRVLSGEEPG